MADITGSAFAVAVALATAAGVITNSSASAYATARATSSASGVIKNQRLSAFATARATSSASGAVRGQRLSAYATARATSTAAGSGNRRGASSISAKATATARGAMAIRGSSKVYAYATNPSAGGNPNRNALGVCDVYREILMVWGIESPCSAPDYTRINALNHINNALQVVWNQARDRNYWTRTEATITLAAGISSQVLDDDIQNIIGPARLAESLRPLSPITTRGELDQFVDLFLDGVTPDEPVGYFIERINQAGNDPVRMVLHVTPPPEVDTDFLLDVVNEAPRFTNDHIDSCPRIPIPHRYVESLLLPVVRYYAMSSHLFVDREGRKETIEAEYAAASALLDEANPIPVKA